MTNFIQQAYLGKNEWWRYLLTLIFVFLGWQIIGVVPLLVVAAQHTENTSELMQAGNTAFANLGINSNLYLFVMICTFAIGLFFLLFGIKSVHLRKIKTVLTARKKIDWKRFFFAFFVWFTISVILIAIDYFLNTENYVWNFKPVPFFILVIISFLFMPLQTSFEEILFRGYFMQGIGVWVKNAWIPLIITSVVFGLLHSFNPEVEKLGMIVMVYYIGTGFLYGIITLMDDGTELALGLHASNNIVAATLVTMNWTVFQTDALFVDLSEPSVDLELYLPVFVIYPLLLLLFSKKYGWKNWKEKLTGNIQEISHTENTGIA